MAHMQIDQSLLRRRVLLACLLTVISVCSKTFGTEHLDLGPSPELAQCQEILRHAGATPADLAQFAEDMRHVSRENLSQAATYLRQQSPAALTRILEDLRLNSQYTLGADSKPQSGVPHGKTFEFTFDRSKSFPGTTRKITVYVPAAYTGDKPACVYVGLDGLGFEAPTVFDNLIAKHDMPITIAIGIEPGMVTSANPPQNPRFNRSFEFDGLNDNLARFLLEEVFPEIERRRTPDRLPIVLSKEPNDRAAGGGSTGGIGAFTLAWERPDAFRRVFTAIGTFVGMRGGDRYPILVRKTEPKAIRIFMQDGANDQLTDFLGEVGDWWLSNQTMNSALQFAGYQVQHVWGEGSHNGKHATAVFPDAMRWLWKDWPQPVTAGVSKNVMLGEIVVPGEVWESVGEDESVRRLRAINAESHQFLGSQGRAYQTDAVSGEVWLTRSDGRKTVLDSGLKGPTGIALSPDGSWLAVAESKSHWGYSYRVQADGTVQDKQRFYWFHVPDEDDDSGVGGWVMDREGRLYGATRMGVQVFDRNGRVRVILPTPSSRVTELSFGGKDLQYLYVLGSDGKAYRRRFKVPGVLPGSAPIQLPAVSAG